MYGVETFVHPDYQGHGVGSKLMDARANLVRRLNLRGIVAGSLFVGYKQVADQMSPEQYVQEVVDGKRFDPQPEQTASQRLQDDEPDSRIYL
jgi:GNAT superfamily N-acetyltransferase